MPGPDKDITRCLADARAGYREAFDQMLEACRAYLLMVAREHLDADLRAKGGASDLVQETFLAAHQHFDQFRGTTEAELLGWLRQTLLHKLAHFKRRYLDTDMRNLAAEVPLWGGTPEQPEGEPIDSEPSPSEQMVRDEEVKAVHSALERLSEEHRRVILLRIAEQQSFEEIGHRMGRTANAAEKLFARALRAARQELETPP
jgi:RNA polymerase sigma-70 factor (ECF subfamily)